MGIDLTTVLYALLTGFLPVFFWLWFWMRQDCHPEPKTSLLIGFVAGCLAVIASFFLEKLASGNPFFPSSTHEFFMYITPTIEELAKFVFASIFVLHARANDERIDPMIYMITVALGFAALENTLFLLDPFIRGDIATGFITGNMRFIGATLIHTVSSATIGFGMAIAYCWSPWSKKIVTFIAIIVAIGLHGLFNFFIIKSGGDGKIYSFIIVWGLAIVLMIAFQRIRQARQVCPIIN
jgi:RsiW-degrading membrane proteinase PrsW (M82 family)